LPNPSSFFSPCPTPLLSLLNSFFFYDLGLLAPRPTLLPFLGLGPARNKQLRPRMGCVIYTSTSFKNLNYMLVVKILDKFEVYFDGVLKYTFCAELCWNKVNWLLQPGLKSGTVKSSGHCFLGAFAKQLQQATVRLGMSVRSCHQTTRHPRDRFSWNFIFRIFNWKLFFETFQLWLKSGKITMPYVTTYVNVSLYNCDRLCSLWGTSLIWRNSWSTSNIWDTVFLGMSWYRRNSWYTNNSWVFSVKYELRPKKELMIYK
jgi:hypothetical protein